MDFLNKLFGKRQPVASGCSESPQPTPAISPVAAQLHQVVTALSACSWTRRFPLAVALLLCMVSSARTQADPFFFIQLSDPQLGMFAADSNFVQETANLEFAIATVNRLKPAFLVVTGDLVNRAGDGPQIAEYKRIMAKLDPVIPLYNVAGNHDVEPTPASIAAYRREFGPDHYSFRHHGLVGIVLNSTLIQIPQGAPADYEKQERWLAAELRRAKRDGARHLLVFQHHSWFLKEAEEADQYFNIPAERRMPHLELFRRYAVSHLFGGHYHRNEYGQDGAIEMVTTGPIGMPLGKDGSGLRVVIVRDSGIVHRYYEMDQIPNRIDLFDVRAEVLEAARVGGADAAIARYWSLKTLAPQQYIFDENQLNEVGYWFLQHAHPADAVRIFFLNVEQYPNASNPYDSLGEAYLAVGDTAHGITNYRRSVQLNPNNENGISVLKRLGVKPQ